MAAQQWRSGLNPPEVPSIPNKAASFAAYFCAANTFFALQHEPSLSCKINSALHAKYPSSTDRGAAAAGVVSTHFAALSSARVAPAAAFGLAARNFPFTMTAQQYSSL